MHGGVYLEGSAVDAELLAFLREAAKRMAASQFRIPPGYAQLAADVQAVVKAKAGEVAPVTALKSWLSDEEAARPLGLSVRRLRDIDELEWRKQGRRRQYEESSVEGFRFASIRLPKDAA